MMSASPAGADVYGAAVSWGGDYDRYWACRCRIRGPLPGGRFSL